MALPVVRIVCTGGRPRLTARLVTCRGCGRPTRADLEAHCHPLQLRGILRDTVAVGGGLLDHNGILLRHLVHLVDRGAHLSEAVRLLLGAGRDLTDHSRHLREQSVAFFHRTLEDKAQVERQPPSYRGYIPLASEGLARSLGRAEAAADLKEAFSMGPVDLPTDDRHLRPDAAAHFAPNRWPAEPARFQPVFEAYYRAVSALADKLLRAFALALDVPENWFSDKVDHHISNVRALYYPAQSEEVAPGTIRAGEHTDYGCLTILLTEPNKGGLEVVTKAGEWEPVPHLPGSFVVNIGDLMAQWSNDRYVSTMHRVVNPPRSGNTGRLSVAFFHQPNHDALIECIPGCATPEHPPRYAPIASGDHRLLKVSRANTPVMA